MELASASPAALGTAVLAVLGMTLVALVAFAVSRTRAHEREEAAFIAANMEKLAALAKSAEQPITALVTGANSGIGYALSQRLASAGIRVVLGCRSRERGMDAIRRIQAAVPGADARFVQLDVSEPWSVLRAAAELRDPLASPLAMCVGGASGRCDPAPHLDFLVLNAGIMPVSHYRWGVPAWAFLTGRVRHFLETSRGSPHGASFLAQPVDSGGACGAPEMVATHVLGHLLLVQELQGVMGPLPSPAGAGVSATAGSGAAATAAGAARGAAAARRVGRVVWTGSRSAAEPLYWAHLQPPLEVGALSGFQQQLRDPAALARLAQLDSYGHAKYLQDLLVPALARRLSTPCHVICPGFVDTELTPPFFRLGIPIFGPFRAFTPGFNISGDRGTAAQIAVLLAAPDSLAADKKWVLSGGGIAPARAGSPPVPWALQEAAWMVCERWLRVWREAAAAGPRPKAWA